MKKKILIIVSLILCVAFNMLAQNKVCSIKDSVCSVKEKLELLIIPQNSDENKSDVSVPADVTTLKPNPDVVTSSNTKEISQKEGELTPQEESLKLDSENSIILNNIDDKEQPATNNNTIKKEEKTSTTLKFSKKAKLSNIDIQKNIVSARGTLQGVIDAIDTLQQELDKYKIYQFLGTESDSIFHAGYIQFADNQIPYYAKAFYDYITDVHEMYNLLNFDNRDFLQHIEWLKEFLNEKNINIVGSCIDLQYSPFYENLTNEQRKFIVNLIEVARRYQNVLS